MPRGTPGAYVLLIWVGEDWHGTIGSLGHVEVPAGWAAYVGSAMGGLEARVNRHLRHERVLRWHIDWLTMYWPAQGAVAVPSESRIECALARALEAAGWARGPRGFGASDCRCSGHLLLGGERRDLQGIRDCLPVEWQGDARLVHR